MDDKVIVNKLIEKYNAGDYICKEGDDAYEMYIIKSGKIELLKEIGNTSIRLTTLGPKDFFGEMALFGQNKRTSAVKAIEPSELIIVNKLMLETQYRRVPEWLVTMIKTIANRIITTSKGVKGHFKIGEDYSVLRSLLLMSSVNGTSTDKSTVFPVNIVRDELLYTLGMPYDAIDIWLKRFHLVNLVSIKGGTGMLEIPNVNRLKVYTDFLFSHSREGKGAPPDIDQETLKSFERIYKLMQR